MNASSGMAEAENRCTVRRTTAKTAIAASTMPVFALTVAVSAPCNSDVSHACRLACWAFLRLDEAIALQGDSRVLFTRGAHLPKRLLRRATT